VAAAQRAPRTLRELQTAVAASKNHTALQAMKLQDAQNKVNAANLTVAATTQQLTKAQHDVANAHGAASTAVTTLGNKLAGQASAQANTFNGRMKAIRTEVENNVAEMGQKYGPALTKAGAALAGVGSIIKVVQGATQLFRTTQEVATAATDAATVSEDALNASLLANPIVLILAGIALLIAAIIVIGLKFGWWKDVINDTWGFIKIAFGDIWGTIKTVYDWIVANWPLLLAVLTGPVGLAVYFIVTQWGKITSALSDVMNWISQHAADIWQPLADAAKAVWNAIATGWNDTIGALNFTVPGWVPFLGGHSFGFPKIPTLAQGGYVQSTGLALVHEGETVVPPGRAGGAVVHIENAHFGKTLDVDAFMARVAWHARLARI
jgi:hypothetical protein